MLASKIRGWPIDKVPLLVSPPGAPVGLRSVLALAGHHRVDDDCMRTAHAPFNASLLIRPGAR